MGSGGGRPRSAEEARVRQGRVAVVEGAGTTRVRRGRGRAGGSGRGGGRRQSWRRGVGRAAAATAAGYPRALWKRRKKYKSTIYMETNL